VHQSFTRLAFSGCFPVLVPSLPLRATMKRARPADAEAVASASGKAPKRPRSDADAPEAAAGRADDGKSRFILFVGNVPFTAPRSAVLKQFECVGADGIVGLRMLSRKKEEKLMSDGQIQHKGCGFMEFADEGALKKALGLHHTFIKGFEGRKINVELTVSP